MATSQLDLEAMEAEIGRFLGVVSDILRRYADAPERSGAAS